MGSTSSLIDRTLLSSVQLSRVIEPQHNKHESAHQSKHQSIAHAAIPQPATVAKQVPLVSQPAVSTNTRPARWWRMSPSASDRNDDLYITELITLPGSIGQAHSTHGILIDSGATCNFVDQSFVDRANLEVWNMPRRVKVRTADGNTIACTQKIPTAHVKLPNYHGHHEFIVVPHLDGFDAVLGRSFLKTSGAIVHHASSQVSWSNRRTGNIKEELQMSNMYDVLQPEEVACDGDERLSMRESTSASSNIAPSLQSTENARQQQQQQVKPAPREQVGCPSTAPSSIKTTATPAPAPAEPSVEHLATLNRILERVSRYEELMREKEGQLPPSRGQFDHKIELKDPDARPVKSRAIPLNAEERAQLVMDIKELEDSGLIERSESEWASPAFYVDKDGGLDRRLVIDYRALNKLLKRNTMTLPHVEELMARLGKAKYFTKIDLRSSYHQILVRPSDRHMTAFVTPIGHYQWCVLPFGEANAPATFVQMIRHLVLKDMTGRGIADFVDDLLVHSETLEEHERDVNDLLSRLEQHGLFIKPSKCQWMVKQVNFLGFTITATDDGTTIAPMHSKIEAVTEWPAPRTQTQMRSFLGFANTFRSFIDGFSRIAAPLFDTLKKLRNKKTAPLRWTADARQAFDQLKEAITNSATLGIADANKPFIVHTDASDYAVGAVLSQLNDRGELRPIGFVSQKLTEVEYRWSVYEKELFSIVVALQRWSMHLMHAKHPVEIHNDHASLRYLLDQPKLTAKQTRWLALLSTFAELRFIHVRGSDNARADALSRRADHDVGTEQRQQIRSDIAKQQFAEVFGQLGLTNARINTLIAEVSAGDIELTDAIIAGYEDDDQCKHVMLDPASSGYRLRWDMLERVSDNSILVPNVPSLRARILRCVHDAPTSGHLGINKTHDRLSANYHWANSFMDVIEYVQSCDTCQRSKMRSGLQPGMQQSSEITPKAHTIALDFLGPLTRTKNGKDSVLVVMDTFTKRVFLEAVTTTITADKTADIIINRVVRHQGIPRVIRSDRDSRFTGEVWNSIWDKLGSQIKLTTSYHHQSNALPERFMQNLTASLRAFVNERGTDWDTKLVAVEMAYNTSVHSTTGMSPIELDLGIQARMPLDLCHHEDDTPPTAAMVLERIDANVVKAFRAIHDAQERDDKRVNASRRDEKYEIGELAWLDTNDLMIMHEPGKKKLRPRWAGPFKVIRVENELNVELELPAEWRIHPVIHIARLKRAHIRDQRFVLDDSNDEEHPPITREDHDMIQQIDLGDHNDRGAAIAQVEREDQMVSRPRTRANVQTLHDRGDRYDFVELRDAHDERRQHELIQRAASHKDIIDASTKHQQMIVK